MFKEQSPADGGGPDLLPGQTTANGSRTLLPAQPSETTEREATGDRRPHHQRSPGGDPHSSPPSPSSPSSLPRPCHQDLGHSYHHHALESKSESCGDGSDSHCRLHHLHNQHHTREQGYLSHNHVDKDLHRRSGVSRAEHPMKRLMTYVKTVIRQARARLLWSRRCLRCQFSFLTISESSADIVTPSTSPFLDDDEEDEWSVGDGDEASQGGQPSGEDTDCLVTTDTEISHPHRRPLSYLRKTCKQRMSRVTLVSLLWSLLSLVVAGACAFSFCHPNWITHPDRLHSFGLFTHCVRDLQAPYPRAMCYGYGPDGGMGVGSIPAGAWQASTLLFGGGVCLQGVGALVTIVLLLLPSHPYSGRRLALLCGYVQILAVLLLLSGLVMFPLGFSTDFFRYYCDSAGAFCVGHCRMGWGYVLAITSTALAIFCPVLSNYTDVTLDKEEDRAGEADLVTDV